MANAPSRRLAVPVFVKVTDWGRLFEPTTCEANVRLLVERVAAGAGAATPEPDKDTLAGLPAALLAMLTLAERVPSALGPKLIDRVQELPAAGAGTRVAEEQASPAMTKSPGFVPPKLAVPRIRLAPPVFVIVMTAGSELELMIVLGNTSTFVESPKIGAGGAVPVPLS